MAKEKKIIKIDGNEKGQVTLTENIEVPKSDWDNLMKTVNELKSQNEMLIAVADKRQIGSYMAKGQKKGVSIIHLREFEDKIVLGWRTVKDYVGKNPLTGVWTEDQETELVFEDGTTKVVFMKEFEMKKKFIKCKAVGKQVDETNGEIAYKLIREDTGKEYLVASTFVN